MTKENMLRILKAKTGFATLHQTEVFLDATVAAMRDHLASGGQITLKNFGSFRVVTRKKRPGRNPQTGAAITIPASRQVKFTPGKDIKAATHAAAKGKSAEWLARRDFARTMDAQLREVKAKLATYAKKSEALGVQARHMAAANVGKLEAAYENARYQVALLKGGSEGALHELKKGAEAAYLELRQALKRALEKF